MPQIDDSLLDELLQKLRDDESEEDPLKYLLEKVLNELLEKEMSKRLKRISTKEPELGAGTKRLSIKRAAHQLRCTGV